MEARGLPQGSTPIDGGLAVLVYVASFLVAIFRKVDREKDAPYMVGLLLGAVS